MNNAAGYTIRIDRKLLEKFYYIAKYEGRSANKQFEQLVKKQISEFEKANGEIKAEDIKEMYSNKI